MKIIMIGEESERSAAMEALKMAKEIKDYEIISIDSNQVEMIGGGEHVNELTINILPKLMDVDYDLLEKYSATKAISKKQRQQWRKDDKLKKR